MKLIVFTNCFPYGNVDTLIENELGYLIKQFNQVTIVPLHYGGSKKTSKTSHDIIYTTPLLGYNINHKIRLFFDGLFSVREISFFVKELISKKAYRNKNWFMSWLSATCVTRALLRKNRIQSILNKIDEKTILYFYWGDKSSGLIPFLRKRISNPIVVRFHGSDLFEEAKGGYQPFRKDLLKCLSVAVSVSEKGLSYLQDHYPDIAFNGRFFRLGVNDQGINKPSNDRVFRILTCSHSVKVKRVHLLVQALKLTNLRIHWTHIGDGPLQQSLMESCRSLPENITTTFTGWISSEEIINYYRGNSVDLFLNVSESEGIPVSIMEALSFGIPVIATNVGGVTEIVNDAVGKLVTKNIEISDLMAEIETFSKNSDLQELRNEARKYWHRHYNAETNYRQFAQFLHELITK